MFCSNIFAILCLCFVFGKNDCALLDSVVNPTLQKLNNGIPGNSLLGLDTNGVANLLNAQAQKLKICTAQRNRIMYQLKQCDNAVAAETRRNYMKRINDIKRATDFDREEHLNLIRQYFGKIPDENSDKVAEDVIDKADQIDSKINGYKERVKNFLRKPTDEKIDGITDQISEKVNDLKNTKDTMG